MDQPSLKYVWAFFDRIFILGNECPHPPLFAHFNIPYTTTNASIEDICKISLQKKYRYILVLKSTAIPTENIDYFSILRLKQFIQNTSREWDILSIASKPSIMYSSKHYINSYIYTHPSMESAGYIINKEGMLKFKAFQRKKTILHHTPFLFKKKENYQWLMTLKEWYGSYINIPVVYIPFMIAMIILKYYSRKIMNRFRRSPNITLLIQGQYPADDWEDDSGSFLNEPPRPITRSQSF